MFRSVRNARAAGFESESSPRSKVPKAVAPIALYSSQEAPIVLSGPPGRLAGQVNLHNRTGAKIVLRDAGLKDPSGALQLPVARHRLQPIVLRPEQHDSVRILLAADLTTAPGEYRAELELDGHVQPVVLHVTEVVDLKVVPRSLVIANEVGAAQRKRVIITNDGNVPFALGDAVRVDLHDDMQADRVQRVAVESLGADDRAALDPLIAALVAVAREEPAGCLQVRSSDGPLTVAPGETRSVELEFTLVDELSPMRRYRGRMPVVTRDVEIVVVPAGTIPQSTAPATSGKP